MVTRPHGQKLQKEEEPQGQERPQEAGPFLSGTLKEAPTKQKTETDSKSSKQQNNKHEESEQPDKPHLRTS